MAAEKAVWAKLTPVNSALLEVSLVEGEDEIWFGRSPDCKIISSYPAISGKHARLFRGNATDDPTKEKNQIYLEPNSKNGTFVNRNKIENGKRHLLKTGDEITLLAPDKATAVKNKISEADFIDYIFHDFSGNDKLEGVEKAYAVMQELGSGTFATVKLAVNKKTGEKVAIKVINKSKSQPKPGKSLMDEVEILRKQQHPNIIKILDIYESPSELQLVLELVHGGDLLDRILQKERYKEDEAKIIFKNIVEAVHYMHSHGYAHRDLKPENILLVSRDDDTTIKLTDFGVSRSFGTEKMQTLVGTPQYLAPEIIKKGRGAADGYTVAVDLWSLGVILYVLLSGFPPFEQNDFAKILAAQYSFNYDEFKNVSSEAKDLIKKLLTADPNKRLTAEQTLQHPWLTGESSGGTKRKSSPKPSSPKAKSKKRK